MGRPRVLKNPRITSIHLESAHLKAVEKSGLKLSEYIRDLMNERFSNMNQSAELQKLRRKSKELEQEKALLQDENRKLRIKIDPEVQLAEQIREKAEELLREFNDAEDIRIAEKIAYHKKLIRDYKPLKPRDKAYKIKFKELVDKRVNYGIDLKEAKQLTREQIKRDNILNLPTMPEVERRYELVQNFMEDAKRIVMEEQNEKED